MKKIVLSIAAILFSFNAMAVEISVGEESFSLESSIESAHVDMQEVLSSKLDSTINGVNPIEMVEGLVEQAMSENGGSFEAAVMEVADAAATGAANGHSAAQVMESARTGEGVCVTCD